MNRTVPLISFVTVLTIGFFVKAQTVMSKPRPDAEPSRQASHVSQGDGGPGTLAAVADPSVSPEAAPLARKMIKSFRLSRLGRRALAQSNYPVAEQFFRQALAAYPRSDEAKTGLAQALEGEGRSDEASNAYRDAFKGANPLSSYSTFPSDIAALARHGIVSEEAGEYQEAVKSFNMARQWLNNKAVVPLNESFDPKGLPTPQLRAMLEVVRGVALIESKNQDGQDRSAEALEAFGQAARLEPNDARVQFYHGYGLRKAGQFAEAQAAFQKAAQLDTEGTVKAATEDNLRAVQAHRR